MKISKIARLVAPAVLSMSLVACGSSDDNKTQPPTPSEPSPPVTETETIVFPEQSVAPQIVTLDEKGAIFISEQGLSLYLFDNDSQNKSTCNAEQGAEAGKSSDKNSCAAMWPPLLAGEQPSANDQFSTFERDDGTFQWAWNGHPLYQFADDSSEGDTNGDGINNVWHLVRPNPVAMTATQLVANGVVLRATSASETLELARENKDQFSLYTFDLDEINKTNCTSDSCVNSWPPIMADAGAHLDGKLSLVQRGEQKQWAYNGKPLYLFANDETKDDKLGDNLGNVWHIATTEPATFRTIDAGTFLTANGIALILEGNEASEANLDQFTLYTFDNDTENASNCNDDCAATWPPFLADEQSKATGDFTIFTRADGFKQWAYKTKPVYFFKNDTAKGQTNGDGLAGVWHVISPTVDKAPPVTSTQFIQKETSLGQSISVSGNVLVLLRDENGILTPTMQDKSDFALYIFNVDDINISNCNSDQCIDTWPPLLASSEDQANGPYSIIDRADGFKQWAINGKPLYFFTPDTDAQTTAGEGVGDVWYVARPAPIRLLNHDSKGTFFVANSPTENSLGKNAEALNNLTLYTFDVDVKDSGESACLGSCAATWPPLYANENDQATGLFSIIERSEDDGSQKHQWAYKGKPLYFFTADSKLGDTFGDYAQWPLARQ